MVRVLLLLAEQTGLSRSEAKAMISMLITKRLIRGLRIYGRKQGQEKNYGI